MPAMPQARFWLPVRTCRESSQAVTISVKAGILPGRSDAVVLPSMRWNEVARHPNAAPGLTARSSGHIKISLCPDKETANDDAGPEGRAAALPRVLRALPRGFYRRRH